MCDPHRKTAGTLKSWARYCRSQYDSALHDRKKEKPGEAGLVTLFDLYQGRPGSDRRP
jgi:hypothetical protein